MKVQAKPAPPDAEASDDELILDLRHHDGRPRDALLEELTRLLEIKTGNNGKTYKIYQCSAKGCVKTWNSRTKGRVLGHASQCLHHTTALRQKASAHLGAQSPAAHVEKHTPFVPDSIAARTSSLVTESTPPASDSVTVITSGPNTFKPFLEQGKAKLKHRADHATVVLFCVAGLPPNVISYPEYRNLSFILNPAYTPMSRSTLADTAIPSTQAHVQQQQTSYLQTQLNMTVSFDGGSTRKRQGFYSIHALTSDDRAFLQDVADGCGASHTAHWIHTKVLEQMTAIGLHRFAAVTSDSTGNTKLARRLLCISVPTLLDCPDPIHHTNLMIKDICKLPYFKTVIETLSKTIAHFSHSNDSTQKLDALRKQRKIGRGLEKVGKTRFATVTWSALSLQRCMGCIRELVEDGSINLKVCSMLLS